MLFYIFFEKIAIGQLLILYKMNRGNNNAMGDF